jgi:hypothetical protein
MITLRESAVRGSNRPTREGFQCTRCGTTNRSRTPDGSPWCADCLCVIAVDPEYLLLQNTPEEAQRLLDRWVNGRRGNKRRTIVAV